MGKLTIAGRIERLTRRHNGKCLSMDKYVNEMSGLLWECEKGHQWLARCRDAETHWCPECPKPQNKILSFFKKSRHIIIPDRVEHENE